MVDSWRGIVFYSTNNSTFIYCCGFFLFLLVAIGGFIYTAPAVDFWALFNNSSFYFNVGSEMKKFFITFFVLVFSGIYLSPMSRLSRSAMLLRRVNSALPMKSVMSSWSKKGSMDLQALQKEIDTIAGSCRALSKFGVTINAELKEQERLLLRKKEMLRKENLQSFFDTCLRGVRIFVANSAVGSALLDGDLQRYLETRHECPSDFPTLFLAVLSRNTALLKFVLVERQKRFDIDSTGKTPLHYAAWMGCKESVKILVAAGYDPEFKDLNGDSPIDIAELYGNVELAELLRDLLGSIIA